MNSNLLPDTHHKFLTSVKGLMLWRNIILTLLLAITFFFQISEKKYFFVLMTNQFYYFIGLFYLVTIGYSFFLNRVKDLRRFTSLQIGIDHLFIAGLIYYTGGKESFFPIAYIFSIIGSSIIFYKRGAFLSASLSTFLYGFLLLLQLYQWISPSGQPSTYEASQIFYSLIIYMAAFYIVAFLSSAISEELKKKKGELIQKQVDYNELEVFNRNIIQSLDSGLLTIDLDGKINFLNRTAEKILNRRGEELQHISIYDLFPKIEGLIDDLKKKGAVLSLDYQRYETILTHLDGRKIYLGFSISPLSALGGALIGYTLIFQDITRFKEMEEQMKRFDKMAAIGSLAAGMAHEIRNPLASLSGSIQMLKSELTLDHHQQHLMEITLRESERLNALITDFLLFAHPPLTRRTPWEVGKIIDETIELFIHSPFFHDGIHIGRTDPHKKIEAMVDPDQLRQVFWNLLINAAQAISNGGEIRIQMEKGNGTFSTPSLLLPIPGKEKGWTKVIISDSGAGIAPHEKDKIFEPFYTTKEGGTGLGLSIVHKIIENHNGAIKVDSEVGKGSTFTLFLPAD